YRHARPAADDRAAVPLPAGRRRRTGRRLRAQLRMGGRREPQPARQGLPGAGGHRRRLRQQRAPLRDDRCRGPMTATDTTPVEVPDDPDRQPTERWRGRFDEQGDDLPIDESLSRTREARALLYSLLRPYRLTVALLAIVVVVENAARLSVPILVQRGIDHGIPPILSGGSAHALMVVVAVLCGVVVVQATSRMFFLQRSGRCGQEGRLEWRRRVSRHFQGLDIASHERYTPGRVVSRSTNDVEAIQDMRETGFDSLITGGLPLIGTAILLVTLDVR